MSYVYLISETLAGTIDNTFVGTLLAGLIIAYCGLWLYRKQKKVDIETSRKEKLHDLAVNLLSHINVAMQDYLGQISVYDGSNPVAKAIFDKMESLSSGFAPKETSQRFNKYIAGITQALNDLSTPLALNNANGSKVKALAETIPTLTFLFSATNTLSMHNPKDLIEVKRLALECSDKARTVLEEVISA